MEQRLGPPTSEDDSAPHLTLRVRSAYVAGVAALALHALGVVVIEALPLPPPPPAKPLEFTLAPPKPPPPPPAAAAPRPPEKRARARATPRPEAKEREIETSPPAISPVAPELAPSPEPSPTRAQLPVVERAPEPAPPPKELTWAEELKAQLRRTRPRRVPAPTGMLAPSFGALHRVAANDPRMHDEDNQRRLMFDNGAFFQRGLDSLRGNWRPGEVLRRTSRDPSRRCGVSTRTTFAVAVLDKAGNVVDVDLKEPSGCDDLDKEAVAAFRRVANFPRPPSGIFTAPDGTELETARFPVHFIVAFDGHLRLHWQ